MAKQDIHECGFSCPVFSKQGENFTTVQFQIYVVIGNQVAKLFCDAAKAEKRFQ